MIGSPKLNVEYPKMGKKTMQIILYITLLIVYQFIFKLIHVLNKLQSDIRLKIMVITQ